MINLAQSCVHPFSGDLVTFPFAKKVDWLANNPKEVNKINNLSVKDVLNKILKGPLFCSQGSTKGCVMGCLGS